MSIQQTDFWKKIKHFKKDEFACNCGCGLNIIDKDFVKKLDLARSYARLPFSINSGCRCKKHNRSKKVKGRVNSSHLYGLGVDIECLSSRDRSRILVSLLGAGFVRIGIYKNFIHVDNDLDKPQNVIW